MSTHEHDYLHAMIAYVKALETAATLFAPTPDNAPGRGAMLAARAAFRTAVVDIAITHGSRPLEPDEGFASLAGDER